MKDRVESGIESFGWHHDLLGGGAGIVERLGRDHAAIRAEEDAVLLVTFERAGNILADGPGGRPLAAALAEDAGWSRLSVVARGETWFRDPAVYAFFDRLIDEGYFDRFDRVVFYGDGMCGHAAAAYSVAAPGATVIALAPQATLNPAQAGWDPRFAAARRLDFTSRFGFAPDMIEAAGLAMIVYDPRRPLDAMHAALFRGPNVVHARAPFCGSGLEEHLLAMGVLPELIDAAGEGHLTAQVFHRLFRARRTYAPYVSALLDRVARAGRIAPGKRAARSLTGTPIGQHTIAAAPRKPLGRFLLEDMHRVPAGVTA